MNKKILASIILLAGIICIMLIPNVFSAVVDTFSNALTTEDLTFTGNQNITRFLNISRYANVSSALMSLGYVNQTTVIGTAISEADDSFTSQFPDTFGQDDDITLNILKDSAPAVRRAIFRFPLATIPSNALIDNVLLNISQVNVANGACNISAYLVANDSWTENQSWNSVPAYSTYLGSVQFSASSVMEYTLPLTNSFDIIQAQFASSDDLLSVILRLTDEGTDCTSTIASSEDPSSPINKKPYVAVTYHVLPTNASIIIDNATIWSFNGLFNQTSNNTKDFAQELSSSINSGVCDCEGCSLIGNTCSIPIIFHSDASGTIYYDLLNVTYTMTITPTVPSNLILAESNYTNLLASGINYGETSTGLSAGTNITVNLTALDDARIQYLLVRATQLDASLNIYMNEHKVGNIPSDAGGTGAYRTYGFYVSVGLNLSNQNIIKFEAPVSNGDVTYIDWIALADSIDVSDGVVGNKTVIVLYSNSTNVTATNKTGIAYYQNASLIGNYSNMMNYNLLPSSSTNGNIFFAYVVPQNVNENYTFNIEIENDGLLNKGTNFTVAIDSIIPVINYITTDLNCLVGNSYLFEANITENNDLLNSVSSNDSSITDFDLSNETNGIWNGTISYSSSYSHRITVTATDKADHAKTFSFDVKSSNATVYASEKRTNRTFDYSTYYFNVSDTSTANDVQWKVLFNVTGTGNAYIDDLGISYFINDTNPLEIRLENSLGSLNTTIFSNLTTNLSWTADAWNNSVNGSETIVFQNAIKYNLNNSLTLEWENSGVNNIRLFYAKVVSKNDTMGNISIHVPLRTSYSGSSSSLNLYSCTAGINWGAGTCGVWSEITSQFYTQDDETYHWDATDAEYPTVDESGDGNKDTLYFKIPSITVNGEVMFKIDLDASNAETSWTTPSPPSGGTSVGGGSSDEENLTGMEGITGAIPSSLSSSFLGSIGTWSWDKISGIGRWITNLISTFSLGLNDSSSFFIMIVLIVLALIFILVGRGGRSEGSPSSQAESFII